MNKHALKKTTIKILTGLMVLLCLFATYSLFSKVSAEAVYTFELSETLAEEYKVGTTLKVPTGKFVSTDSEDMESISFLVYPDGTIKKGTQFVFEDVGVYILRYSSLNGNLYKEYEISIYNEKYSVNQKSASVSFGTKEFQVNEKGDTIEKEGLYVILTEGSVFEYNKTVNMTGKSAQDLLFNAYILPSVAYNKETGAIGEADFNTLTVRFTDTYDKNNYVDFILKHQSRNDKEEDFQLDGTNYMKAGHANQDAVGCIFGEPLNANSNYGAYTWTYFMGNRFADETQNGFEIYMDYASKKVYQKTAQVGADKNFIVDLDDTQFFSKIWDGFTTGECKVSVFASDFVKASATIFIDKIFEDEGAALKDNILYDIDAPIVSVNLNGLDENNLPFAMVNKEYPLFEVSAYDVDSKIASIGAKVYYNYHSNSKTAVSVKNGKFVPTREGAYTIEYYATDYSGNVGIYLAEIECKSDEERMMIALEEGDTVCTTGYNCFVKAFSLTNASGNYNVSIFAINATQKIEIDTQTLKFLPMAAGDWTIKYTVIDYIRQEATASYTLEVENQETPVFVEEISMPKQLIAGYAQTLPSLYAYDFIDSGNILSSEIWISENGGAPFLLRGNSYTPSVLFDGDTYLQSYDTNITYKVSGKNATNAQSYILKTYCVFKDGVVDRIDKNKLFLTSENVTAFYGKLSDGASEVAMYTANTDAQWQYINALPANNFSVVFSVLDGKNNFEKLTFRLIDSTNDSNSFAISLKDYGVSGLGLSINGGVEYPISDLNFTNQAKTLQIGYDNVKRCITFNYGAKSYEIPNQENGKDFIGFVNGKVYLQIQTEGVSGETGIAISSVCSLALSSSTRYNNDPMFVMAGVYERNYSINSIYEIYSAVCLDAVRPEVKVTATLIAPNGDIVVSTDGKILSEVNIENSYFVKFTQYGQYVLLYTYENGKTEQYIFNVVDEEKPEILPLYTYENIYKKGAIINLGAMATDKVNGECKVVTIIENPMGRKLAVTEQTLTLTMAGKYKIIYSARDERGNWAVKTVVINVEE